MTTEELLKQQTQNNNEEESENSAVVAYKKNNLQIESKIKLIESLYEGILQFNANAIKSIQDNNVEKKVYWLQRTSAIFTELMNAIDLEAEGTLPAYLYGLYGEQLKILFAANKENSIEKILTVNKVVIELLDAWREVNHLDKK